MFFYCLIPLPYGVNLSFFRRAKFNFKLFFFFKNNVYNITSFKKKLMLGFGNFSLLCFTYYLKINICNQVSIIQFLLSGFLKRWNLGCNLVGVGYRFLKVKKSSLILKLGYSHLLKFYINCYSDLFKSEKKTKLFFFGYNRSDLTRLISTLKLLKIPDMYKAKGLHLLNEVTCVKKQEKFGVF